MDDLLSEKEQLEQLRGWWSENGNYVIAGVVLGGLALFGLNYYQTDTEESQRAASALYDELTDDVVDVDLDAAEAVTDQIVTEHGRTAYAAQARLALARLYMDKNRDQDAADTLSNLLESNADDAFKNVARIRLAKVLLYQGKNDEVLELLESRAQQGAFAARFSDALGDAYFALGRIDEAREAYQRALAEGAQSATVDQQFVQLKLLDLPVDEVPVAVAPADDAGLESPADGLEDSE